jgi:hypothetical protein
MRGVAVLATYSTSTVLLGAKINPIKLLKYLTEYGPYLLALFEAIGAIRQYNGAQKRALALQALNAARQLVETRASEHAPADSGSPR